MFGTILINKNFLNKIILYTEEIMICGIWSLTKSRPLIEKIMSPVVVPIVASESLTRCPCMNLHKADYV